MRTSWLRQRLLMDHSYIEDHLIADRYLSGRLSTEAQMRFEEHFVDCAECLDRLRTIDDFRAGLCAIAEEEAVLLRAYLRGGQVGVLARVAWLIRKRQAPLLAVLTLLIALPMTLMILEWKSARRDLAQAEQTSSEWRRKYEESEQATLDLAKEMRTRERESSLQREQLAAQLKLLRKASDSPFPPSNEAAEYISEAPVFPLSVVRGGNQDLSLPVNRITLPHQSKLIVILLELEPDPDLQSYRVAISTTEGRSIWTGNGLKPNSKSALALSFNSKLFKPGDYLLTLEGLTAQEGRVSVATYTFRALTQ
jgi:hypothetical protein